MKKYKLFIFDLDGVIFNSKSNMKKSWLTVKKKYNIKISFVKYFENIGEPFENILLKLGIFKNTRGIKSTYYKASKKYISLVKLYPYAKQVLGQLKKNSKVAVVTSKNKERTMKFLKKFNLDFNYVSCPKIGLRGKPFPDQIIKVIKKFSIKKEDCVYIGDMMVDFQTAKSANIDFIMTKYGYSPTKINFDKKIFKIDNLKQIIKFQI